MSRVFGGAHQVSRVGDEGPVRIIQVVGRMMGGGVEATVLNHYRHVDRQRVQFDFVVGENSKAVPTAEIEALGGRVFTVPRYENVAGFAHEVRRVIRRTGDPIVHSHLNALSVIPLSVAKTEGVPVRIAHSHSTAGSGELVKNVAKLMLKPLASVAPTDFAACSVHAATWLFGEKAVVQGRVHLIYNAIELPKFSYDPAKRVKVRQQLGIAESAHVIGQVGRLSAQKNQLFLLPVIAQLVKRHRNTIALMVGEGDLRPIVEREITRRGLGEYVWLLGVRSDVADLYQAFDVLAMPSTYEGLGMVAVEAQAAGLHVVASDAVPAEAKLTDLVDFVPLAASTDEWADALAPRAFTVPRRGYADAVAAAGYDIEASGRDLTDWYVNLARRSTGPGAPMRLRPRRTAPFLTN